MFSTLLVDKTSPRWVSLSDRVHDFPAWVAICSTGTRSGILPSTSTGPSCPWTGACAPSPSRVRQRFLFGGDSGGRTARFCVFCRSCVCCRVGLVSSPRQQGLISCSRVKSGRYFPKSGIVLSGRDSCSTLLLRFLRVCVRHNQLNDSVLDPLVLVDG